MPVTSVTKDPAALTMTVVADFPVPVQRLWNAYVDPRQLERFWGPPTYPAQFTRHDAAVGGLSTYAMTGPDGDVSRGYWQWLSVEPSKSFEVLDGFALADGSPNAHICFQLAWGTPQPHSFGRRRIPCVLGPDPPTDAVRAEGLDMAGLSRAIGFCPGAVVKPAR